MKRNLSSQAIKAMAIGMAVTMGATTALSGVVGTVTTYASVANPDYDSATNGSTKPAQSGNSYIEVKLGDTAYAMFQVTLDGSSETDVNSTTATAKLISIKNDTQITESTPNSLDGSAVTKAYKGTIEETKNRIQVVYNGSTNMYLKITEIGDATKNLGGVDTNAVTIDAAEVSKVVSADLTTIANSAFKNVTITGDLDLSAATALATVGTSAFEGATIGTGTETDALKFAATTLTINQNAFKSSTINGNLDLSAVGTLTITSKPFAGTSSSDKGVTVTGGLKLPAGAAIAADEFKAVTVGTLDLSGVTSVAAGAFKGAAAGEGIIVTGELKLPASYPDSADGFAHTSIGTLDLSLVTDPLASLKFANANIGTFKAPTGSSYTSVADAFQDATITNIDLSGVTGTLNANILNNSIITGTLKLPTNNTPVALTGTMTVKDLVHNGVTTMAGSTITVQGNVTFVGDAISTEIFNGTTFSAGSSITVPSAANTSIAANAFNFDNASNTTVKFESYTDGTDKTKIAEAFGSSTTATVKVLIPEGNEQYVSGLNKAITAANVKAYVNNVVAGIDNPSSTETIAQNKYILTADGKLFKTLTQVGPTDVPTGEVAYVGKVEEAGNGGTADGTNTPYVGTLSEDGVLTVTYADGSNVTATVTQIGNGTDSLSKYTINGNVQDSGTALESVTLDISAEKSVKIAANAFENITNITVTSTEGITEIGDNSFKGYHQFL